MKVDVKAIYQKLPDNWHTLKLKEFKKLTGIEIVENDPLTENVFVGADNTLNVISTLTETPVAFLELLPFNSIKMLSERLAFMSEEPLIKKDSYIKWKKPDEITYNDFTFYQSIEGDFFNNIEKLIKTFSKNNLTDEEILEMGMDDVHTAFFLFNQDVRKYLTKTIFFTTTQLAKQAISEMCQNILYRRK